MRSHGNAAKRHKETLLKLGGDYTIADMKQADWAYLDRTRGGPNVCMKRMKMYDNILGSSWLTQGTKVAEEEKKVDEAATLPTPSLTIADAKNGNKEIKLCL